MARELLNEREFELVNIIGGKLAGNQRDLSRQLNLSLGLTNMLLRRLAAKGMIRIQQLNSRKVQYILTPKGFGEKMRKSVQYTLKTINSMSLIKDNMQRVIASLYAQGERHFILYGHGDVAVLAEMIFNGPQLSGCQVTKTEQWPSHAWAGVLFVCKETDGHFPDVGGKVIDLVYEISKENVLIQ